MIRFDRDIVFVDTETLGLDPAAPIWEFAAIRLNADGGREEVHCQILHKPGDWLNWLPERFAADYEARYDIQAALPPAQAARAIHTITYGAIIAGSNPGFDTERLQLLLEDHCLTPVWHYHPLDIPSMAAGYLARMVLAHRDLADYLPVDVRWSSDEISRRIGVNPDTFERHTAMSDVKWCLAQWEAMNGPTA